MHRDSPGTRGRCPVVITNAASFNRAWLIIEGAYHIKPHLKSSIPVMDLMTVGIFTSECSTAWILSKTGIPATLPVNTAAAPGYLNALEAYLVAIHQIGIAILSSGSFVPENKEGHKSWLPFPLVRSPEKPLCVRWSVVAREHPEHL